MMRKTKNLVSPKKKVGAGFGLLGNACTRILGATLDGNMHAFWMPCGPTNPAVPVVANFLGNEAIGHDRLALGLHILVVKKKPCVKGCNPKWHYENASQCMRVLLNAAFDINVFWFRVASSVIFTMLWAMFSSPSTCQQHGHAERNPSPAGVFVSFGSKKNASSSTNLFITIKKTLFLTKIKYFCNPNNLYF